MRKLFIHTILTLCGLAFCVMFSAKLSGYTLPWHLVLAPLWGPLLGFFMYLLIKFFGLIIIDKVKV